MSKPIHVKPQFYAECMYTLKEIAKEHGYNLVLHGSLNRDMDLIAIPWAAELKPAEDMIEAFCEFIGGSIVSDPSREDFKKKYHGRDNYCINIYRGGNFIGKDKDGVKQYAEDPQYYLDISITPTIKY